MTYTGEARFGCFITMILYLTIAILGGWLDADEDYYKVFAVLVLIGFVILFPWRNRDKKDSK